MPGTKEGAAKARRTLAKKLKVSPENAFSSLGKKGQKKRWTPLGDWKPPKVKGKSRRTKKDEMSGVKGKSGFYF